MLSLYIQATGTKPEEAKSAILELKQKLEDLGYVILGNAIVSELPTVSVETDSVPTTNYGQVIDLRSN